MALLLYIIEVEVKFKHHISVKCKTAIAAFFLSFSKEVLWRKSWTRSSYAIVLSSPKCEKHGDTRTLKSRIYKKVATNHALNTISILKINVANFVASKHRILPHNLEFFLRPSIFFTPPILLLWKMGGVNERGVKKRGVKEMFTVVF